MIRSSVSFLFEFKSNLYYSMYWVIKLEKVNNKITKKIKRIFPPYFKEEDEEISKEGQTYPLTTMDEIMKWCKEYNKTLLDYVLEHEDEDILDYIESIKKAMRKSINEGLEATDLIPGKLLLKRRAKDFYNKYIFIFML